MSDHQEINVLNRPRIGLAFSDFSLGGIQRVVLYLSRLFDRAGWHVVWLTTRPATTDHYDRDLCCPRYVIGDFEDKDRVNAIADCVRSERLDVVILSSYWSPVLADEIAAVQEAGAKAVVHFHSVFSNLLVHDLDVTVVEANYRALPRADAVIALSRTDELVFRALGCRAHYIPNPVVDTPLNPRHCEAGPRVVLWSGRFNRRDKRPFEAVKIFERVAAVTSDVRLVMLGNADSAEGRRVRYYISRSAMLRNRVTLAGSVKDVWPYLQQASVYLATSRLEGFSCSLLEAMASEVPIVTYAMDYLELLADRQAYVRVEQGGRDAAAQRIVELLANDERRRQIAARGRRVFESFLHEDLLGRYTELLASMVTPMHTDDSAVEEHYAVALRTMLDHAVQGLALRDVRERRSLLTRFVRRWREKGFVSVLGRIKKYFCSSHR